MTHADQVEERLIASLRSPMTAAQAEHLEARISGARSGAPRRLTPRITRRVALVAAALMILPLGVTAAGILRGGTESPNGLVSADRFQAEITAAEAVVPIPVGMTWPTSIDAREGTYSAAGGRVQVENTAFCLWSRAWLGASAAGDEAASRRALAVLTDYPTWVSYTGEFATQSYRDVVDAVIAGAATGDRGPVARFVTINCSGL